MTVTTTAVGTRGRSVRPVRARRLPRPFWALATCHFVNRAGGFVQPFLVLYLTQDRGVSVATAGAVAAAVGAGSVASQLLGGWLSDRVGRRHTMLVGFAGTALGLIALGSADTMPAIWAAAVVLGLVSDLFRPAAMATVADVLGPADRVRGYGLMFWGANLGFSVSSVSAGVLAGFGFGLLFWINAATSAVAALVVWRRIPETRDSVRVAATRALLPVVARDRLLIVLVAVFVVYGALYLQAFSTLPLAMAADGLGTETYGAVIALNGLVIVVAQPLAVRLLGALDRSRVIGASMLLVGGGFGLGAMADGAVAYCGSVLVWTAGEIGVAVMFGATFADLAPADLRGGYLGLAGTTWGLGSVIGPLAGTAVLDHAGGAVLWTGCAATGAGLLAVLWALGPALRRRTVPQVGPSGAISRSSGAGSRSDGARARDFAPLAD